MFSEKQASLATWCPCKDSIKKRLDAEYIAIVLAIASANSTEKSLRKLSYMHGIVQLTAKLWLCSFMESDWSDQHQEAVNHSVSSEWLNYASLLTANSRTRVKL